MKRHNYLILLALLLSVLAFYFKSNAILYVSNVISDIFISLIKLISLPIAFLSIMATLTGLEDLSDVKILSKKALLYSFTTTIIAASIALLLYLYINPASRIHILSQHVHSTTNSHFSSYLLSIVPSNFVQTFLNNNIIGVIIIAFLLGGATLTIAPEKRQVLHQVFDALFDASLRIAQFILKFIALAIWGFTTNFLYKMHTLQELHDLTWYFVCILSANLIQSVIVLPLMLKINHLSPIKIFKGVFPALTVAFFSKSSSGTLPTTLQCVQNNLGISKKVSTFTLPLCATINMNACAAFIITTVLFVLESNHYIFSFVELIVWVFLATIAAIGNAGVPMGCYFMASAYIAAMGYPLHIMGLILPIYSLLDMLETAINVWSDICVTSVIAKKLPKKRFT